MIVYKSNFQELEYVEDKAMLRESFTNATSGYNAESFKKDFQDLTDEVMKLNGKDFDNGILVDMRNFSYGVLPELQEWHKDHVYPKVLELGVRKMAILTSPDIFAAISAEQTFDEYKAGSLVTQYFKSEDEAMEWLMS